MTDPTPNLPPPPGAASEPPLAQPGATPEEVEAAHDLAEAISTHEWQPTSKWTLLSLFGNVLWIFGFYFFYQFTKIGINVSLPTSWLLKINEVVPFLTPSLVMAIFELAIPVVIALAPILHWWSIRWRLDEQTIEVRQGILWKKHQKMARSRVQTVSLTADLIGRITNTRSVVISSGDTEDIVIALVTAEMAEQLRITIAPKMGTASQPVHDYVHDPIRDAVVGAFSGERDGETAGGASVEHLLGVDRVPLDQGASATGPRVDIARLGFKEWVQFVILTSAPHAIISLACAIPVAIVAVIVIINMGVEIKWPFLALGAMAILVGFGPGVVGQFFSQFNSWGFTSWIQEGRIHSVQGLVSRFEKGAALQRLQTVSVGQNPVRLWLKRYELKITTADAAIDKEASESTILSLVHPLLPAEEWRSITQQLLGVTLPDTLNPPSKLTIYRGIVRTIQIGLLVVVSAGALEYGMVGSFTSAVILAVLTAVVAYPVGLWRYHNFRWAINEECFVVRRGLVFRTITVLPLSLVQNTFADATWFQRRLGLGDVEADVAGVGAPHVRAHDLPASAADQVEAVLVAHANQAKSKDGV